MKHFLALFLAAMLLLGAASAETVFEGPFLAEGEAPVLTETGYRSPDLSITVTVTHDTYKADVTVADIYVRSLECFRRDFGDDHWGKGSLSVKKFAAKTGAVLIMSGDSGAAIKEGLVVGNGTVWRNDVSSKRDVAVVWKDGTMECFTKDEMVEKNIYGRAEEIWHTFLFGPMLLKADGSAFTDRKEFSYDDVFISNPRAAVGYFEPGHYCLVIVAGRKTVSKVDPHKKNYGVDLLEMSRLMHDLGCRAAYNLDGGQSAVMWFGDGIITAMYNNGRPVGDVVTLTDLKR